MISPEQVKLLETKVANAILYVEQITAEKTALQTREAELLAKLDSYQKRIDDFENLVSRFQEDQSRVENWALAIADKVNQLDDAIEKNKGKKKLDDLPAKNSGKALPARPSPASDGLLARGELPAPLGAGALAVVPAAEAAGSHGGDSPSSDEMFFEIPEEDADDEFDELPASAEGAALPAAQKQAGASTAAASTAGDELDIY
ncbi:MAG: hypothetical protein FWG66_02735 [Spirochaetes bacterium]|nr:hypothetical protein [Spirochaetota bacterium]